VPPQVGIGLSPVVRDQPDCPQLQPVRGLCQFPARVRAANVSWCGNVQVGSPTPLTTCPTRAAEDPTEGRAHPPPLRATLMARP
jgi:hypothetical protein